MSKAQLPPLSKFKEVLFISNTRKCLEYLLYFAKAQSTIRKLFNTQILIEDQQKHLPTQKQRQQIMTLFNEIFLLNYSAVSLVENNHKEMQCFLASCQKITIGLIMLGHVHIFQLLIKQLLPGFINIISGNFTYPPSQNSLAKKVIHFCKETIVILSIWFPTSFYDNQSPSWFKGMMEKHQIQCKFVVYYTNQKISQYEKIIKELKLGNYQEKCIECQFCISNLGTKDEDGLPALPSVIIEETSSILPQKSQLKKKSGLNENRDLSQLYLQSEPIQKQLISNNKNQLKQSQREDKQKSESSVSKKSILSERIKKHRLERQKRKSQLGDIERLENQSKISIPQSKQVSKKQEAPYSEYFAGSRDSQILPKIKSSQNIFEKSYPSKFQDKLKRYREQKKSLRSKQSQKHKGPENHRENITDKIDSYYTVKNSTSNPKGFAKKLKQLRERSKSQKSCNLQLNKKKKSSSNKKEADNYFIGSKHNIKAYQSNISHQKSPITSIQTMGFTNRSRNTNPQNGMYFHQSVFESQCYQSGMLNISKNVFRRQCLKINKKRVNGEIQKWVLEIKTHIKNQYYLEVKYQINGYEEKQSKPPVVDQPKDKQVLVSQTNQNLLLSFKNYFKPIVMRIGDSEVLLPISIISMLKTMDLSIEEKEFKQQCEEIQTCLCKVDTSLFVSTLQIAHRLRLHTSSNTKEVFCRFFYFYGSLVLIRLSPVVDQKIQVNAYEQIDKITYEQMLEIEIEVSYMKKEIKGQIHCLMRQIKNCVSKTERNKFEKFGKSMNSVY